MKNLENIKLIDTTYEAKDAGEVIISLVSDKIKFLSIKKLQCLECGEGDINHYENRIKELNQVLEQIKAYVTEAEKEDAFLEVESIINLKVKKAAHA